MRPEKMGSGERRGRIRTRCHHSRISVKRRPSRWFLLQLSHLFISFKMNYDAQLTAEQQKRPRMLTNILEGLTNSAQRPQQSVRSKLNEVIFETNNFFFHCNGLLCACRGLGREWGVVSTSKLFCTSFVDFISSSRRRRKKDCEQNKEEGRRER